MADVFISYARKAAPAARRVASLLAEAGHEVWLDADLPPDRAYSDVIREQLEAARSVVVLWSAEGAKSEWVRAEADLARNQHKLVQATLDNTEPPLPFNQIQCAQLKGWRGDPANPEWRKLAAAVADMAGRVRDAPAVEPARRRPLPRVAIKAAVALVAAMLLGAGAWFAWSLLGKPSQPAEAKVAILPFETLSAGQDARFFSDGLTDKILTALSNNHIQVVSNQDAAQLRGAERSSKVAQLGVALLLDGSVQADAANLGVRVHLDDAARHVTLWSTEVEGAAADSRRLQARIAATVAGVLACSRRALQPSHGLSDPALLTRYLRSCDLFVNQSDAARPQDAFEMLTALREVVAKAPGFAAAHSDLAKFDAYLAPVMPPEQAAAFRDESAREARKALALEPRSPDAFLAQEMLVSPDQWAERERLLRLGVAADPVWPHTNGFLAKMLAESGRVREAATYSQKAAAADLQIDWSVESAWIQAGAGQAGPAETAIARAYDLSPNDIGRWFRLVQVEELAGRWDDAIKLLADPMGSRLPQPVRERLVSFHQAARFHRPTDLARARATALQMAGDGGSSLPRSIQELATLGFLDDAFALAERYRPGPPLGGADSAFLFFPLTANLRRDPRFIALAARIGLVDYWRSSGHWPDFCADPTLPYSCQAEAARRARR